MKLFIGRLDPNVSKGWCLPQVSLPIVDMVPLYSIQIK